MSSLGDRLSAARKAAETDEIDLDDEAYAGQDLIEAHGRGGRGEGRAPSRPRRRSPRATRAPATRRRRRRRRPRRRRSDPRPVADAGRLPVSAQERLEELKQTVHAELLKQLGPKLYGGEMDVDELDKQVRVVLGDVLAKQERPLSNSDRQQITQEISDDILGYGPIEPFLRDSEVSEVMVNGPNSIFVERKGLISEVHAHFGERAAPAPHDRQDRVPDRTTGRRVEPDGGRPPARRQPRQRRHPAAGGRRVGAHDP